MNKYKSDKRNEPRWMYFQCTIEIETNDRNDGEIEERDIDEIMNVRSATVRNLNKTK